MTMDWAVMNSIMAAPNRTCHVTKAPGEQGFGFTLQRQRNMGHSGFHTIGERGDIATGHLILLFADKVTAGSPAADAGLLPQDILLSINNINIHVLEHGQVVSTVQHSTVQYSTVQVVNLIRRYGDTLTLIVRQPQPYINDVGFTKGMASVLQLFMSM